MISFTHVTKVYRHALRPAVRDVDISIDDGEFVFLVGHSGAGKSTILRILFGEVTPESGFVESYGFDLTHLSPGRLPVYRRDIGYLPQRSELRPKKTVFESVSSEVRDPQLSTAQTLERVTSSLAAVGLRRHTNHRTNHLSAGEQRRVAIARSLVSQPTLLLLDEPTTNIDTKTCEVIISALDRVANSGSTVIVATSNFDIVNAFPRRVIEFDLGRVVGDRPSGNYPFRPFAGSARLTTSLRRPAEGAS
jgi:cell division transport system ATP-binding protein